MVSRITLALLLVVPGAGLADETHRHGGGDPDELGVVELPNSCPPEAQQTLGQAMAMLHSFWYEEARGRFEALAEQHPTCSIAWWGVAMSHWQPLWEPRGPNPESFQSGLAAIRQARAAGAPSERKNGYIGALEAFYSEADHIDHVDRVLAYERAMERLHAIDDDDVETRVLYALSLLGSATSLPPDKSYVRQRKAGDLLEPLLRSHPDHPGVAHYLIHAFDYPALAAGALEAARRYAAIAPDSPHAQHMPSHIFTRLGLWDESIASNRNVIEVARKHGVVGEELHGMDYLVFAHLQKGEDEQVREMIGELPAIQKDAALYFAGVYAHAVIPARYAVERRQWAEAASLPEPRDFPGGRYSWADAAIYFTRALGAARTGKSEQARGDLAKLASCRDVLKEHSEDYWALQVDAQHRAAAAWLAFAEGRHDEGLEVMRSAAALEDSADKHPVTPGQIVPAHDLLGQMLLELERPQEALAEFQRVLEAEPNRFGALYGAARSAELAGDADLARERYSQLVKLASDSSREEVRQARSFLQAAENGEGTPDS